MEYWLFHAGKELISRFSVVWETYCIGSGGNAFCIGIASATNKLCHFNIKGVKCARFLIQTFGLFLKSSTKR